MFYATRPSTDHSSKLHTANTVNFELRPGSEAMFQHVGDCVQPDFLKASIEQLLLP